MAFQVEQTRARFEGPDFDKIVHGAADAAVTRMVKHYAVDLLRVTLEAVYYFTSGDLPDADCGVVAPTNKSVPVCSDSTNRMVVTSQDADEILVIMIIRWRPCLHNRPVARLRELPDPQTRVTGSCNDKRFFWHHNWLSIGRLSNLRGFENDKTPDGRSMALENLRTLSFLNIPYSDRSVGRTGYQNIPFILQCPHTTLVAFKTAAKSTGFCIVDIDICIITAGKNFVSIELQTRNYMSLVRPESNVLGSCFLLHPALSNEMMPLIK